MFSYKIIGIPIFTDVMATLTGEMVEIRTNRILWRFTYRTGREAGSSLSRCDDQGAYPQIIEDLGSALAEAATNVADDFFSGASK